jgi:prevent-host-death family protein
MYTVHEAKTNLSRLIEEASQGKEVIIARGKQPVVRLVPVEAAVRERVPGSLAGKIHVPDEALVPLSKKELREWGIE